MTPWVGGFYSPEVWLLVASLLLNLAAAGAVVYVVRGRGGMAYLKSLVLKDNEATVDPASRSRREMYASLPSPSIRPIIFLGDSITVGCEWHETMEGTHPLLNRAIGGDTSLGVLERIADVCRLNALAVFLMIGTNDSQMLGYTPAETLSNIKAILRSIQEHSPDALIYLQSVLPSRVPKFNRWSAELNREIRSFCNDSQLTYIDLRRHFSDETGALVSAYTHDGLHLNAQGYQVWQDQISSILQELQGTRTTAAATGR